MKHRWLIAALLAANVVLVGCPKKDDAGTTDPTGKPVAGKPASNPTSSNMSAKETIAAFGKAVENGDAAGAKALTVSDPTSDKMLDALIPVSGAMKKLNDAAVEKFGEAGKSLAGNNSDSFDLAKSMKDLEVKETGDTAEAVNTKKPKDKPLKMKKVDGKWKIDFASVMGGENAAQMEQALPMIKGMATAANEGADEIKAGKYKTVDEAKQALGTKLLGAMMQNAPKGSNGGAGAPGGTPPGPGGAGAPGPGGMTPPGPGGKP